MRKPIVLIGGMAGTGKTTLAGELCCKAAIDHRIGTGFVREILRSETTIESDPILYSYSYAHPPETTLNIQAGRLSTSVSSCMRRARSEGTSLIIEGTHILPSLYKGLDHDLLVLLSVKDSDLHLKMLQGKSHMNRDICAGDFERVRLLNDYLVEQAGKYGVPVLYNDNRADTLETVLSWIK